MQTDKIIVKSNGEGMAAALEEASKFALYSGLGHKQALRVRLLTEETMGMVQSITGDFVAEFWLESDKDCAVRINLTASTYMDYIKKRELIDIASDKKNSAAKGFMGKIRQLIENGLYSVDEVGSLQPVANAIPYVNMGMSEMAPNGDVATASYLWSLENYRNSFDDTDNDPGISEAKDELEKSIVAKLADDVRVGVRGNKINLVIEKRSF